jgi:hypothetical protein
MGPSFGGSDPADDDGFLRAIEICGMSSFGGEVKPQASCHMILRHVKNPC